MERRMANMQEQEVISAKEESCWIVDQLDANAKLGKKIVKDDPHDITENGKHLLDIMNPQHPTAVIAMDVCKGVITRERITKTSEERLVIDFVNVCSEIKEFVKNMMIDEDRIHVLTKYASKKGIKKHKISDHNILVCRFSIQVAAKLVTLRKEVFLLKNPDDQRKFYQETSQTDKLSSSFSEKRTFSKI